MWMHTEQAQKQLMSFGLYDYAYTRLGIIAAPF